MNRFRPSSGTRAGPGRDRLLVVLMLVLLVVFAAWWRGWLGSIPSWPAGLPPLPGPRNVVLSEQTAQRLTGIPVREKAEQQAYRREAFGQAWADTDHNGCDTRNDVLARDLTQVAYKNAQHCAVSGGVLQDPYTGEEIVFTAGKETSRAVQIDHVVALADAWASGASGWESRRRTEYANDLHNLLAVDGPANEDKGADDAADWLPPHRDFRCEYVARQIAVKASYGLSVTAREKEAMLEVLSDCDGYALP